jgi:hypothetical protein
MPRASHDLIEREVVALAIALEEKDGKSTAP